MVRFVRAPLFLIVAALVLDVACLSVVRTQLQCAADHGALAGVLEIDFELLASGVCSVNVEAAKAASHAFARQNLLLNMITDKVTECDILVTAQNPCAGTGGEGPEYPTVTVEITLPLTLPLSRIVRTIKVRAAASLVPRP